MYIGFIVYMSLVALIWLLVRSKTCRFIVVGAIAFAIIIGAVVLPLHGAMAEERHCQVVIVYYDEDVFVVEYDDGQRDIYDDRGDLVPGDEVTVDGDDVKLYKQSTWLWFDYTYYDDVLASFLYPEDAKEVAEHFDELLGGVNNG